MANCNNSRVLHSGILSKHELLKIIGDQLTTKNVKDLVEKHNDVLKGSLGPLVVDGYSFFLALESVGNVDTSDILKILAMVGRMDLAQFANYRRRKTGLLFYQEFLESKELFYSILMCFMSQNSKIFRENVVSFS